MLHVPVRQSILVILLHLQILAHQLTFEGVDPAPDLWHQIPPNLSLDQQQVEFLLYSLIDLLLSFPEQLRDDVVLRLLVLWLPARFGGVRTFLRLLTRLFLGTGSICRAGLRVHSPLRHPLLVHQIANFDCQLRLEVLNHVTDLVLCVPPGVCGSRVDEVTHASRCLLPSSTISSRSLATTRLLLLSLIDSRSKKLLVDESHCPEDFTELSHQCFFVLRLILARNNIFVVILNCDVLQQGGLALTASHVLR